MEGKPNKIEGLTPEQKRKLIAKLKGRSGLLSKTGSDTAHSSSLPDPDKRYVLEKESAFDFTKTRYKEKPIAGPLPGMVQVQAHCASLNFRDLMIAMGRYPDTPGIPSVMGSDFAGVVTAVGRGVTRVKEGDRVMTLSLGSFDADGKIEPDSHFTTRMNVREQQVFPVPENLSFRDAAGIPTVFATAYYALFHMARIRSEDTVLIHSATGGVGMAGIALARSVGCRIFATAGSEHKRNVLREMGIELVMDSRSADFADEVMAYTNGEGVDVILNTLSGEAMLAGISVLNFFGRFLQIDKKDVAANSSLPLGHFKKGLSFSVIDLGLLLRSSHMIGEIFGDILRLLEDGKLQLPPHTVYKAGELHKAFNLMSRSAHIGKLIIDFTER